MSSPIPERRGPRPRWKRFLIRSLQGIAILLVLAVATLLVLVRRPLPDRAGRDRLPGLSAAATVLFDSRGVPHVRAASEADAYRVLGWLHAGDRFFQMELRRRAARGRLAEVVGPALLDLDLDSRRSGHARAAERDLESLSVPERTAIEAYAGGVNAYLATHPRPVELAVLGVAPEPWTALDTLAFSRFMIAGLSDAWISKVRSYEKRGILRSTDGTAVLPGMEQSREVSRGATGLAGSNAWVLAGSHTASGAPLLANDPHLGIEFPGIWYAAHLTTEDGLDVAGLTLAGAPGVAIGHNGRVAWGITMAQVDDADLYVETLDPEHRTYERDGRFVPLASRQETIRIQGLPNRSVTYYATGHGTLLGGFREEDGTFKAVALALAIPEPANHLEPFRLAGRARTPEEIDRAWDSYRGSAINVCWATADGHIGLRLAGAIPRRSTRDGPDSPAPEWTGIVADGELPRIVDPQEGFIASANDDWSASQRTLPFPGFYATDDRVRRIRALLADAKGAAPADMAGFQNDVLSPYALRVLAGLSRMPRPEGEAGRALGILERWDGRASRAGISRLFYAFLFELVTRQKLGGWQAAEDAIAKAASAPDPAIPEALAAALGKVEREDGTDPASWSWGRIHRLEYEHPFSPMLPAPLKWLRRWLDVGPLELPGEVHTVDAQGFSLSRVPRVTYIPSARIVVDLGNPDASTLVLPLGESGQFQDAHYDDQVRAWAEGRTFPFPFTRSAVDAAATSTLRLEP